MRKQNLRRSFSWSNLRTQNDTAQKKMCSNMGTSQFFALRNGRRWQRSTTWCSIILINIRWGTPKRKPTCLATNVQEVRHLDGVRGAPSNEAEAGAQFRAMTVDQRCEVSRTWSQWALGLKNAISLAVSQRVQWLDRHPDQPQQPAVRTLGSAALESWKTHYLHDHMPCS